MKPVISVIGAGLMGAALVKTFAKQGYETHVWNRTRSRSEALGAEGARVALTVSEAVKTADLIILIVSDYATSNTLMRAADIEPLLRGKALLQLSTGTPKQSREMATWATERGIEYLDGAIMVTPDLVGGPQCTILYSGPEPLFEKYKSALQALGGKTRYLGADYGYASVLDSAILSFFWAYNFGVHQAIALCQAEGFSIDTLTGSLVEMSPFLDGVATDAGRRVQTQNFDAELATLAICHQSVRLLIEQSKDSGVDHTMLDAFDAIFNRAVSAGQSQSDLSVINWFMRTSSSAALAGSGANGRS